MRATVYVHVDPKSQNSKGTGGVMIGTGGGPQSGRNCCIYSVGYDVDTGRAPVEEEGAHDPHPTISPIAALSIEHRW
jgi:hypothetical protein